MPVLPSVKKRSFRLPSVTISRADTERTTQNADEIYKTRENGNHYKTRSGNVYVARSYNTGYLIVLPSVRKRSFRLPVRING